MKKIFLFFLITIFTISFFSCDSDKLSTSEEVKKECCKSDQKCEDKKLKSCDSDGAMLRSWNFEEIFQQPSSIEKTEFYKLFEQGDIEKIVFVIEGEYTFCEAYIYDSLKNQEPHSQNLKSGGYYRFDLFDRDDVKRRIDKIKAENPELGDFEIENVNRIP